MAESWMEQVDRIAAKAQEGELAKLIRTEAQSIRDLVRELPNQLNDTEAPVVVRCIDAIEKVALSPDDEDGDPTVDRDAAISVLRDIAIAVIGGRP